MSDPIEDACMACLDRWMAALNRYDAAAMDLELHFPHVRFAESKLTVFDKPLYMLALKDGRWGVQLRSSFGP